jgi:hypothetical protein
MPRGTKSGTLRTGSAKGRAQQALKIVQYIQNREMSRCQGQLDAHDARRGGGKWENWKAAEIIELLMDTVRTGKQAASTKTQSLRVRGHRALQ